MSAGNRKHPQRPPVLVYPVQKKNGFFRALLHGLVVGVILWIILGIILTLLFQ